MKKGKGRPPKSDTIELRRIETLLNNVPPHIKKLAPNTHDLGMLESMEYDRQQILSDYQSYPTLPHSHIFEMASIGDEAFFGCEAAILQKHAELLDQAKGYRRAGGADSSKHTLNKAEELCNKNRVLLARVKPLGPLSLADAARKIKARWAELPPELRQVGEEHLDRRGIDAIETVPSSRTIERYICNASPFCEHRIRQGSWPKK